MAILPATILLPGLQVVTALSGCSYVQNAFTDLAYSAARDACAKAGAVRSGFAGRRSGTVPFSALQGSVLASMYRHPEMVSFVERVARERRSPMNRCVDC